MCQFTSPSRNCDVRNNQQSRSKQTTEHRSASARLSSELTAARFEESTKSVLLPTTARPTPAAVQCLQNIKAFGSRNEQDQVEAKETNRSIEKQTMQTRDYHSRANAANATQKYNSETIANNRVQAALQRIGTQLERELDIQRVQLDKALAITHLQMTRSAAHE